MQYRFTQTILHSRVKTKILEAMSMGVPVVTNDIGAEGIEAKDGQEFWVRNDSAAIAGQVDYLLGHYDDALNVAEAGKKLVEEKYEWEQIYRKFEKIMNR